MIQIGSKVRCLPPFESLEGEHEVIDIIQHDDGQVAFILNDIGAFDIKYIEEVV